MTLRLIGWMQRIPTMKTTTSKVGNTMANTKATLKSSALIINLLGLTVYLHLNASMIQNLKKDLPTTTKTLSRH